MSRIAVFTIMTKYKTNIRCTIRLKSPSRNNKYHYYRVSALIVWSYGSH